MSFLEQHPWLGVRPWRRHSTVLVVAGFVYIVIGFIYAITPPSPERLQSLWFADQWWPLQIWGYIFMVTGLLAIVSSRWPPISKTWGYTVMTGLSGAWSAFYFVGVLFGGSPIQNLSGSGIWGLVAFLWWAISGLSNPGDRE